jgi:hypothetical protein
VTLSRDGSAVSEKLTRKSEENDPGQTKQHFGTVFVILVQSEFLGDIRKVWIGSSTLLVEPVAGTELHGSCSHQNSIFKVIS